VATTTFLFTDIEGSTRIWEDHPDAMRGALAVHDRVIAEAVADHGGRVFKHTGDGTASAFDSARAAVEAAVAIQKRLLELDNPEIGALAVRMGVHSGEVEERNGDYFGPALNRAARLMDTGHGGQILVSLVSARLADGLELELADLGEHRLRDLSQPERVFQVVGEGLPQGFPPLRSLEDASHNLPIFTTSFVGRTSEIEQLTGLIGESRLVTVTGVGGAGKTRLALHAAAELLSDFSNGTWLVELAPVADPDLIDGALSAALGLSEHQVESLRQAVLEHLADRSALLIVDNCEHLISEAADLVSSVLSTAPNVTVIATSREPLGVPGETIYGLRSMGLPPKDADPTALGNADSVRLFAERASSARPDFVLSSENVGHVAEICRRLDGMPLAIELAAARLRSFSPHQMADLLDQRFRLLTGGSRTALPRQQTLTATIEWSYRLLDDAERVLFRRLAVFQGGFSLDAAQEVCGVDPLDTFDVIELLPHLVDKSLVSTDTSADEVRYRLLETLRQFARDRLDETEEGLDLRGRHAIFYRNLVLGMREQLRTGDEKEWIKAQVEDDNLRAAMRWALDQRQSEMAISLACAFSVLSMRAGRWSEPLEWIEEVVTTADIHSAPSPLQAELALTRGNLRFRQGRLDLAEELHGEAVERYRQMEAAGAPDADLAGLPDAINNYSLVLFYTGSGGERNERYIELQEQTLEAARKLGDRAMEALALGNMAHHRDPKGDPEKSRRLYAEAERAHRALGMESSMAAISNQRALFEFQQREFETASRYFARASEHFEKAGNQRGARSQRMFLAASDVELGDPHAAGRFVDEIRWLFESPDARASTTNSQTLVAVRAGIDAKLGQFDRVALADGISQSLVEEGHEVRWDLVDHFERAKIASLTALGDECFAELAAEGREMSHDETIEFLTAEIHTEG